VTDNCLVTPSGAFVYLTAVVCFGCIVELLAADRQHDSFIGIEYTGWWIGIETSHVCCLDGESDPM
jgi:hypothetical protein